MAGPVTMALGAFMFRAHGFGYTDLERTLDTSWAELNTAGRLNALQWTGPKSDVVVIKGVLFPKAFGGTTTLEGVKLAAKNGVPLMLVSLGGRIFGRYAIQKVTDAGTLHDRNGTPLRDAYTLELKRSSGGISLRSLIGSI